MKDIFCKEFAFYWIYSVEVVRYRYYLEEGRDMSEWEEDLLALFDSLDEAAQAAALAAALKIISGEIL